MNKTRLLLLNYEYPPLGGGAANATKCLLEEFKNIPHIEVDLVTSSIDNFRVENFASNIKIHFLDIGKQNENLHYQSNFDLLTYSWKAYFYAKKLIKKNNFDLIHAFFGIPCGYMALKLRLPYIVSLRGSDVPFYSERFKILDRILFRFLSKKIWKQAKLVVANSAGLRNLAFRTSESQKIEIIPNGINIKKFFPQKILHENFRVLFVGRLIERKNIELLLKAILELNNDGEKIEFWVVGEGNLTEKLKDISKNSPFNHLIKFMGIVPNEKLFDVYNACDLFVMPSKNEGMSNTVLEAMACGLPILISDTGGTKELFDENGLVLDRVDLGNLKNGLLRFREDAKFCEKTGEKSRKIVEKKSWGSVADKYLDLYQKC